MAVLILLGAGGALAPACWAEPLAISLEGAVASALASSPGVEGAGLDLLSAAAKAREAEWKRLPSLGVSASYQKLSDLPATSVTIGGMPISFPAGLTNIYSFTVNMQYPVFAGFRLQEAVALARVQEKGKAVALEMVKRSLVFEVERAYWEAIRATNNLETLGKNVELAGANLDLVERQEAQGAATLADKLAAQTRYSQADLDLGDAAALRTRAFLALANLAGGGIAAALISGPDAVTFATSPESPLPAGLGGGQGSPLEEAARLPDVDMLIAAALAARPETRVCQLATEAARHGGAIARGALYPSLTLSGNYSLADPNQRVAFQSDPSTFTGTWALGIGLSCDLGGLPANLAEVDAQDAAVRKSAADELKQRNAIVLDVRNCELALRQANRDVRIVKGMIDQAMENTRVTQRRFDAGTASRLDLLGAQLSLLRAEFAVMNREIDVQEARADLARAIAVVGLD
ncbi:MAG: TolC family protein [Spirochaetes bacterium]|nr:TolC family protein [Spirochaetota bacterium]